MATQYKVELSSTELVPGDYVLFPTNGGYTVECDAVLVDGSCVVNESMLTGESIPVTKVSIPDENVKFNYDQQRQYIIFQGTQVSLTPFTRQTCMCNAYFRNNSHYIHIIINLLFVTFKYCVFLSIITLKTSNM